MGWSIFHEIYCFLLNFDFIPFYFEKIVLGSTLEHPFVLYYFRHNHYELFVYFMYYKDRSIITFLFIVAITNALFMDYTDAFTVFEPFFIKRNAK